MLRSGVGHDGRGQHHQVGGHLHRPAAQRIRAPDDDPAVLGKDPGDLAPNVEDAFLFHRPLDEFLIVLSGRADVDVEDIGLALGDAVLVEHGVFGRVHTTDARTIGDAAFGVAGADALDKDDLPGDTAVGGAKDLAGGGAGGRKEAFELKPGEDVGDFPGPVLAQFLRRIEVEAGGDDDGPHFLFGERFLLLKVDRLGRAEFFAGPAPAPKEVDAGGGVDDRLLGHGLRRKGIDGLPDPDTFLELGGGFGRALFLAQATAGAEFPVDVGRMMADADAEVADLPFHPVYLRVGIEADAWVLPDLDGTRGEDTLGAVQGGESLRELEHMSANGGAAFDQHDLEAGVGDVQGRLHSGDAGTDNQGTGDAVHRVHRALTSSATRRRRGRGST